MDEFNYIVFPKTILILLQSIFIYYKSGLYLIYKKKDFIKVLFSRRYSLIPVQMFAEIFFDYYVQRFLSAFISENIYNID